MLLTSSAFLEVSFSGSLIENLQDVATCEIELRRLPVPCQQLRTERARLNPVQANPMKSRDQYLRVKIFGREKSKIHFLYKEGFE